MQVSNIKFYRGVDWDNYVKLPGYSFSFLKNDGELIAESEGMRIGKLVHTYMMKPELYNFENADIVIPIARELVKHCGPIMRFLEFEVGITADFEHEGLVMPWRGMPDGFILNQFLLDFKVMAGDLRSGVERFLYQEQVRGYMLPVGSPIGLIVGFNKRRNVVETHRVGMDTRWWEYKIKQYGRVAS